MIVFHSEMIEYFVDLNITWTHKSVSNVAIVTWARKACPNVFANGINVTRGYQTVVYFSLVDKVTYCAFYD